MNEPVQVKRSDVYAAQLLINCKVRLEEPVADWEWKLARALPECKNWEPTYPSPWWMFKARMSKRRQRWYSYQYKLRNDGKQ